MAKITTRKQRDRIVNKLQNKETVWLLTPRTTTRWGGKIGEDIYNPGYTSRIYAGNGVVPRKKGMFSTVEEADNLK
jgi:hypothetical protein